ncbi:MAG: ATP-dependent protease ATPase subunit HslU [Planctomycetota bacterium]|nr:MAG: ATP-dependent protease ATPase subunit HslU [Planctomycetota bacterium]
MNESAASSASESPPAVLAGDELTPRRIVQALDRYIIGQTEAKKAVAIAIRNRIRRLRLSSEMREEVVPKNLILIGPTGVGKTEIARRIANLTGAPFVKVEASKFTEVGYVGRDVESIIRELADAAVNLVRQEQLRAMRERARPLAEERLLDALLPGSAHEPDWRRSWLQVLERGGEPQPGRSAAGEDEEAAERARRTREKLRRLLREGKLEEREVEIALQERVQVGVEIFGSQGVEQLGAGFQNLLERMLPPRTRRKRLKVAEARRLLEDEEAENLLDRDKLIAEALERAATSGIVFIDELDKICAGADASSRHGPDVSREGVQRDLLPIIEGSTVSTRYGVIKTDHVLFIAAGAFHMASPSDLIPELQGRFPIRVELHPLGRAEFARILREPDNALTRQYAELLAADGVTVSYDEAALDEIARIAEEVNSRTQDIGARRLHTLFEKLLEDPLFEAPDGMQGPLHIDVEFVRRKLGPIVQDEDLSRFIL